ncbi:MAG: xanthine phosphoribosyltransferase [Clostridiales bacterium]|jgi:xanthine phosphoribosyltransferase|nr:xanthine phosphoribosyltransferase [Clostridiales bacterium]
MELLKQRILQEAKIVNKDVLRVDMFLNHQIDVELLNLIGKEFKERFRDIKVNKILTVESSGIAIACITAQYFSVPVIFAKKHESNNFDVSVYQSSIHSFTKDKNYIIRVSKEYIKTGDEVLILDDFLANGQAVNGLIDIVDQAGAKVSGIGIVIEKEFQNGGSMLRKAGYRLESLVIIESFKDGNLFFK